MLDADPGEGRVQIVAAIHEPGAGVHLLAEPDGSVLIARPDSRGQSEGAVVHLRHGFIVRAHLHDPGDRSKDLLAHDRRAGRGIEEQLRRQIRRTGLAAWEAALLDRRPRASLDGRAHLRTYRVRRGGAHHRAERGLWVQRVAEPVPLNQLDAAAREALMNALVNVDTLQAAAGLTGVEVRPVHDVLHGVWQIGIVTHIHRIAAAEFEPHPDETLGGDALHRPAAGHRAGEGHEVDARIADDSFGVGVPEVQYLEQAGREPRVGEALGERFRAQGRLGRVLQHHGVAGQERRHHAVYRDQIGVIPGGHGEHDAERLAAYEAPKARLWPDIQIGECRRGDAAHVAGTLERAAHLARSEAYRPPHLPAELRRDPRAALLEFSAEALDDGGALGERHLAPQRPRRTGALQSLIDLRRRSGGAFRVHPAVDRRHTLDAHMISK